MHYFLSLAIIDRIDLARFALPQSHPLVAKACHIDVTQERKIHAKRTMQKNNEEIEEWEAKKKK